MWAFKNLRKKQPIFARHKCDMKPTANYRADLVEEDDRSHELRSSRRPERDTFIDDLREQPSSAGLSSDAVENPDQQAEGVFGHLEEIPSDLERYVHLIRLCDRNEKLFYKVLMSSRLRFLLSSQCRRNLLEIWFHLQSTHALYPEET